MYVCLFATHGQNDRERTKQNELQKLDKQSELLKIKNNNTVV